MEAEANVSDDHPSPRDTVVCAVHTCGRSGKAGDKLMGWRTRGCRYFCGNHYWEWVVFPVMASWRGQEGN